MSETRVWLLGMSAHIRNYSTFDHSTTVYLDRCDRVYAAAYLVHLLANALILSDAFQKTQSLSVIPCLP